jgi:hypothetical protein
VKFKSIIIMFNILLLLFLAALILLPRLMLGVSFSLSPFAGPFWRVNWSIMLLLTLILAAFNTFYFINRRLFMLLEKEDWPALVRYLEGIVIQRGRYSSRLVRLLANSYLVLSDSPAVMSLENKTAVVKPSLVNANVLVFGTARILGKDISGAIRFFETRKNNVKAGLKDWVCWYHGFALLLNRQFEEAGEEFSLLARLSKDGIITGLSAFFLSDAIVKATGERGQAFGEASSLGRKRVLKSIPALKGWNREASRLSSEIHAAAISRYMGDTGRWLYGKT